MSETLETHRETVLESPYSRDREEAIEELERLFPEVGDDDKRRVLETLRQVASEATSSRERERAVDAMLESFDADPDVATSVVVPCFCDLAADGKHRDERLDAIDALREIYPAVDDPNQERIGQRLAEIAGDATYEDIRRRARQRLADVTAENERADPDDSEDGDAVGYLGQSLAEHLANAAEESPEACRQRVEELQEFITENPVDDDKYDELCEATADLEAQLTVAPTGDELGEERKQRVRRIANRAERIYRRKE